MRIIAGEWRGRPVKAAPGDATRPTTDRVREALMSSLSSLLGGFDGLRVLDAFAGSGALGLETVSRGAAYALLNEQGRDAARCIEQNLASLGAPRSRARLRCGDAYALPSVQEHQFDPVFLDPPYAMPADQVWDLVAALDTAGLVAPGAVVCYECAKKDRATAESGVGALQYRLVAIKNYGATSIIILRKETSS